MRALITAFAGSYAGRNASNGRNASWHGCAVASVALGVCFASGGNAHAATPDEVVLVINDASEVSKAVGAEYARLRTIANVLHVRCIDSTKSQANETLGYHDFVRQIETPIENFLAAHSNVNFIALTKGMPIRVSGAPTGEADSGRSLASLDSTLASIGYGQSPNDVMITFNDPSGFAVGTAWLNNYWGQSVAFSHAQFGGYLVTRLDGYTKSDALALTRRALDAEAHRKNGLILLDIEPDFGIANPSTQPQPITTTLITQESPYNTWNGDMKHAAIELTRRGIRARGIVTTHFIGNRRNLLGYFSWGSNDDHFSQAAYNSLTFAPGAVGDTAVSTSARSFFPQTSGQSMIADLITQGISGVRGYTDEPLLQGISSPTIVLDRYTRGYSLAESFYAGSHFVGWTDIVVGDPLAHPYPSTVQAGAAQ
jgi:uncharacterized protein (TIGR03790 family)